MFIISQIISRLLIIELFYSNPSKLSNTNGSSSILSNKGKYHRQSHCFTSTHFSPKSSLKSSAFGCEQNQASK